MRIAILNFQTTQHILLHNFSKIFARPEFIFYLKVQKHCHKLNKIFNFCSCLSFMINVRYLMNFVWDWPPASLLFKTFSKLSKHPSQVTPQTDKVTRKIYDLQNISFFLDQNFVSPWSFQLSLYEQTPFNLFHLA